MILATIKYRFADSEKTANLDENDWEAGEVLIESYLNRIASPACFGPADGDPVACAADRAAAMLYRARVTFVRPIPPVPAGSVH